jgi:hypothetical protein
MGTERRPGSMAEQLAGILWPIVSRVPVRTRVNGAACNKQATALRWEIEIRVVATAVLQEDECSLVVATVLPPVTEVVAAIVVPAGVQATQAPIAGVAEQAEAEIA